MNPGWKPGSAEARPSSCGGLCAPGPSPLPFSVYASLCVLAAAAELGGCRGGGTGAVPICTRARPPPLRTLCPPYPFFLRSPVPRARLCGGPGWGGRPPGTLRGDQDGLGAPGRSCAGARPPPLGISAGCFLSAPARRPGGGRASAVSGGALPGAGVDCSAPLRPGPEKLLFLAPTSWATTKPPITGRAPLQPAGSRLELGVGGLMLFRPSPLGTSSSRPSFVCNPSIFA